MYVFSAAEPEGHIPGLIGSICRKFRHCETKAGGAVVALSTVPMTRVWSISTPLTSNLPPLAFGAGSMVSVLGEFGGHLHLQDEGSPGTAKGGSPKDRRGSKSAVTEL